jgi:hypothetical protein
MFSSAPTFSRSDLSSSLSAVKHRFKLHHDASRNKKTRARSEIATLLLKKQYDLAKIRAESLVTQQWQVEAEEVLSLMCELLRSRIELISSSSSSQPSRILAVSEKFSPSKWLVVYDAPLGRAVAGEAAAAVEYHSISVTPLEELVIKEGEGGGRNMTSSTSISTLSLPLSSSESSVAEVTGLLEFATIDLMAWAMHD